MYKQLLTGALLLAAIAVAAQQEAMQTQFMFNKLAYNPGFAGSFVSPTLTAIYRQQWMGLDGAPNTQALSYSQPVLKNRVGFGGNLARTSIGISEALTFDVAYAYRVAIQRGFLGIGLQASMRFLQQDWTDPRLHSTSPLGNDIAIPAEPKSKLVPNFGFGLYYTGPQWYAGVSAPRLVSNNIDFAESGGVLSREVQHFFLMGGATFNLSQDFELTPQLLFKYVNHAPFDADLNLSALLKQRFYAGLTYRTGNGDTSHGGESLDAMLGMQATRNLFFCLSYDIGLTPLKQYNNGSIEATARWWFNPPEGEEIVNPNRPEY